LIEKSQRTLENADGEAVNWAWLRLLKRHEKRTGHGYKRYEWKQGTRRPTTQEN